MHNSIVHIRFLFHIFNCYSNLMGKVTKTKPKKIIIELSKMWWLTFAIWILVVTAMYYTIAPNIGFVLVLYALMLFTIPISWVITLLIVLFRKIKNKSNSKIAKNTLLLLLALTASLFIEAGLVIRYYNNEKNHTDSKNLISDRNKAIIEFGSVPEFKSEAFNLYTDSFIKYSDSSSKYVATYTPTTSLYYEGQKYTGTVELAVYNLDDQRYSCNKSAQKCISVDAGVQKYSTKFSNNLSYFYTQNDRVYELSQINLNPKLSESETIEVLIKNK